MPQLCLQYIPFFLQIFECISMYVEVSACAFLEFYQTGTKVSCLVTEKQTNSGNVSLLFKRFRF